MVSAIARGEALLALGRAAPAPLQRGDVRCVELVSAFLRTALMLGAFNRI